MQAAYAEPGEDGSTFVMSSTQHPSEVQHIVAHVLHVPVNHVVVQSPRMGGGFGGKETQAATFAALAALAAAKTKKAVRVRVNRDLDMMITGKRHPFLARFEVGYDADGKLLAAKIALHSDGGWSLDLSMPVTDRALFHLDNSYYIPQVEFSGQAMKPMSRRTQPSAGSAVRKECWSSRKFWTASRGDLVNHRKRSVKKIFITAKAKLTRRITDRRLRITVSCACGRN